MSFRVREKATMSPRAAVSPRAEVGEIDTRAPFQSVKAAVSLFGEVRFSKEKPITKKSKPPTEGALDKETRLLLAQNELMKLKEQLKNAETTQARVLRELEKAKRTHQELTHKIKAVSESKQSAIDATEAVKNQLKVEKSNKHIGGGGAWQQDLNQAKEQYKSMITEIDAAKQELTKIRQDFDASLEAKTAAFEEAADAQHASKVNTERVSELLKEIAAMKEALSQVKLASEQARQELAKILEEKDVYLQSQRTAMEEADKKLVSLKNEFDSELPGNLEEKLAQTTTEIEALQEEKKNAHASDMESMRIVTLELDEAKKTLQQVAEEESSLQNLVHSLKLELEDVKRGYSEIEGEEAGAESVAANLQVKLQESKAELEAALSEETKAKDAYDELISTLQKLSSETENARPEAEEVKKNVNREISFHYFSKKKM